MHKLVVNIVKCNVESLIMYFIQKSTWDFRKGIVESYCLSICLSVCLSVYLSWWIKVDIGVKFEVTP